MYTQKGGKRTLKTCRRLGSSKTMLLILCPSYARTGTILNENKARKNKYYIFVV